MFLNKEIIRSRQNKTLIWAASLSEKKYRDADGAFSADGFKLFDEACKMGAVITHVFIAESKTAQFLPIVEERLKGMDSNVVIVADGCFDKITKEKSPQGIVTILKYLDKIKNNIKIYKDNDYIGNDEKIIILSSVRDPSNIGAVLRSASAFGTNTILMSRDCADVYQPKCVRAAMGALFRTKILICDDLCEAVLALRDMGRRIYAAELTPHARSLDAVQLGVRDAVIIGNEGHGIPAELSSVSDGSVYLPIAPDTESLNASVAASIFLWEMRD